MKLSSATTPICLPPQRSGFDSSSVHEIFMVVNLSLGHILLQILQFPFCHLHSTDTLYSFIYHRRYVTSETESVVK